MWEMQHNIVDWVDFKTQTLLGDLEDSKSTSGELCAYLEVVHLFQSVGCARTHKTAMILSLLGSILTTCQQDGGNKDSFNKLPFSSQRTWTKSHSVQTV